ncbi:MAG: SDR family oxidoreductase [Caldilineaceae bacterium SB0675_bin_29]|uniref:SDR family oxidoreductase n=1 Tax=Caldilineaceae bacterium SB0675_bin_29 TaxID=2605266 RepID=A0A6B1G953_9CHLR|nr:SDR family oxidoreductase [Caldilineaceae bacterium SB0675_bin_29]
MQERAPELESALNFAGKVALISGGGRGIGAGISKRFAEAGATVVVSYLQAEEAALEVVEQIQATGGQAQIMQADVSRADDVERLISQTVERCGRLDVLVNNAGVYPLSPLLDMADDEWEQVLAANLTGTHNCTQRAARAMIELSTRRNDSESSGSIINISSIEAASTAFAHSHYTAAKAGVEQYTRNAALELGEKGIRVNAVAPGLIDRPGLAKAWPEGVKRWQSRVPLARLGTAEDIADACLFLASPLARWITGVTLAVDGGILVAPAF